MKRIQTVVVYQLLLLLMFVLTAKCDEGSKQRLKKMFDEKGLDKRVSGLFQNLDDDLRVPKSSHLKGLPVRKRQPGERDRSSRVSSDRREIQRLRQLLAESRIQQAIQIQKLTDLKQGVKKLVDSLNTTEVKSESPNEDQALRAKLLEKKIAHIHDFARVNYETGEIEMELPGSGKTADLVTSDPEKMTFIMEDFLDENQLLDPAKLHADLKLLVDIVVLQCAAAVGGILAAALRMPPIVGYIAGGAAVGPSGADLLRAVVHVETIAQYGSILFLFAHGVQFSKKEQRSLFSVTSLGTFLSISMYTVVIQLVVILSGIVSSPLEGGLVGISSSISSFSVVLEFVQEERLCSRVEENVVVGILSFQGLLMGLLFSVPAALSSGSVLFIDVALSLVRAMVLLLLVIGASMGCVRRFANPALSFLVARARYEEVFLLGVVTLAMMMALLTEYLGLSMDLGAFFAGLALADTPLMDQAIVLTKPLASFFASLLFASIGMIINFRFFASNLWIILFLSTAVSMTKWCVQMFVVRAFGFSWRTSVLTGGGLAQVGEFSLLLSSKLHAQNLLSRRVYLLFLSTTVTTLVLWPLVLKLIMIGLRRSRLMEVKGDSSKV